MSAYARPGSVDEALELLARRTAPPCSRAAPTSPGRSTAGSARPRCSSTCRTRASAASTPDGDGLRIGATTTLAELAARRPRRAVRGRRDGRRPRGLAAPAQPGHRRRQPLPAHALLVLPRRGVDLLARRRRHLLRADRRPPQAQPRAGRLHLGASLRPRSGARRVRRDRRRALARRRAGDAAARSLPPSDRRQPLARHARARARSSSPSGCPRRPTPRRTSARASGRRSRSRSSRSRRLGAATPLTLAAAGVANIPRALDPADPLAGLPGHPQSAWKRKVLATLVERAHVARASTWALTAQRVTRGVVTARMSAMWTSCRAGRAMRSDSCAVLDLADPLPDLGGDRQRAPDQVRVRDAVDVRLVRGVEREPEATGPVGLAHPEERHRHRDVLVDARERERLCVIDVRPLGAVSAGSGSPSRSRAPFHRACRGSPPRRTPRAAQRGGRAGAGSGHVRRGSRLRTGSAAVPPGASGRAGRRRPTARCRRRPRDVARSGRARPPRSAMPAWAMIRRTSA